MLRVPLFDDESLTSYCARLAAANVTTATSLCQDMGFSFQEVVYGSDTAISGLAEYGGIAPVRLLNAAVCEKTPGELQVGGELMPRKSYARMRFRFCPACFQADERSVERMPGVRRYMRRSWPLRFLRTCHLHDCPIVDLGLSPLFNPRLHDFMENLDALDEAVLDAMRNTLGRQASAFERYLIDRLDGRRDHGDLLDGLALHNGAYLCELVGSAVIFGTHHSTDQLDEMKLFMACQEGLALLKEGSLGLEKFLDMMHSKVPVAHIGKAGGKKLYGRLYTVLQTSRDARWDGIKSAIRDYAFAKLPLPKSSDVFGKHENSHYFSDSDIMGVTQLHPKQLRKIAVAAGLLDVSRIGSGVIPKTVVYEVIERLNDWVLPAEAAALLGVTYASFRHFKATGLFPPGLTTQNSIGVHDRHSKREVLAYLDTVRSLATFPDHTGLKPLDAAARSAACRIVDAAELVRSGRLAKVGWDQTRTGLPALMIDPRELAEHLTTRSNDFLAPPVLEKMWKMSSSTVYALLHRGVVPTVSQPVRTRMVSTFVKRDEAEAFIRAHVTFVNAAKDFGVTRARIREAARRAGLSPLFAFEEMKANIYDRVALKQAVDDIADEHLPQEAHNLKNWLARKKRAAESNSVRAESSIRRSW